MSIGLIILIVLIVLVLGGGHWGGPTAGTGFYPANYGYGGAGLLVLILILLLVFRVL